MHLDAEVDESRCLLRLGANDGIVDGIHWPRVHAQREEGGIVYWILPKGGELLVDALTSFRERSERLGRSISERFRRPCR